MQEVLGNDSVGTDVRSVMNKLIVTPVAIAGLLAFGSASQAAGQEWFFDLNGDQIYDTVRVDRWGDGVADVEAFDWNQNGVFELFTLDTNNDGVNDVYAVDTYENGYLDRVDFDYNLDGLTDHSVYDNDENGVDDAAQISLNDAILGATVVGPPTSPGAFSTLMTTMAGITGQATFGSGDWDGDGWFDYQDWHPSDPTRP